MTTRKRTYVSVFGVNHENADLSTREEFYLSETEHKELLENYSIQNIENVLVLNTCNRTEIYTMSDSLQEVINIYRDVKKMNNENLHNYTFIKYDKEALKHFFEVGSGLRSKILGDYQIIGQMRSAYKDSIDYGLIGTNFERLFQSLFSAAKEINNKTKLNHGSASHGYQVASIINGLNLNAKSRVLIIGAGDMAQKTLAHLLDYSKHEVTMVNRTYLRLHDYENISGVTTARLENLPYLIHNHEVIISTIPVANYINEGQASRIKGKIIFDLTVPSSISYVFNARLHTVFDIEDIEIYTQKTLEIRKQAVAQVEVIIEKHIQNFYNWSKANKQNQVFRLFESELEQFLFEQNKLEEPKNSNIVNPQKITELFMKSYYSKLASARVV